MDQHAAGEDVGLDEVGAGRIAVEQGRIDRDELQRRAAAGRRARGDGGEIGVPIFLADRLDHLDRGDGVELFVELAIVGQADLDLVGEPAFFIRCSA